MQKKQRLGELLVAKELVRQQDVEEALRLQVGGNRRLGYILIRMGLLTDEQLLDVLSEQLDLPFVDVEMEFEKETRYLVPKYICRRYSVIPLSREENNVLRVAMINPMDGEAIASIENFTGLAVKPILARRKDVDRAIGKLIPFSPRDIFNPDVFGLVARVLAVVAIILALSVGIMVQRFMHEAKYGTFSEVNGTNLYKHLDLMVGYDKEGKVSLLGRGAYSQGYYSVSFNDVDSLEKFIEQKKQYLSQSQFDWLIWVTGNLEKDQE